MAHYRYDVVHVASLPKELGAWRHSGLGHVVWGLSRSQDQLVGLSVAIAARGAYFRRYQRKKGIDIYGLAISPGSLFLAIRAALKNWKEWFRLMGKDRLRYAYALYFMSDMFRRLECNVLHVHHVSNLMSRAARACGYDGPVVVHIHSYSHLVKASDERRREYLVPTVNRLLQDVDAVVHVSQHSKLRGRSFGVRHTKPDHVIYNGIKPQQTESTKIPEEYSVCFVGSLRPIKGVGRLLEALALLERSALSVCWVGSGPLEEVVRRRCQQLNISFEITGFVPNEEARNYMRTAQVLVVPSRSESFGQVYLEALSEGTPVVGFAGTVREFRGVLEDPEELWLQPYDHNSQSAWELRNMIVRALNMPYDPESHRRIQGLIQRRFGWRTVTKQMLQLYRSV